MTSIGDKAAHVRQAADPGGHTCHWPGCNKRVKPALWGCPKHWYTLPARLRALIWRTYRAGQEDDKRPSGEYLDAAHQVQEWISEFEQRRLDGELFK